MTKKKRRIDMARRVYKMAGGVSFLAFSAFFVSIIWEKWGRAVPCAFCKIERFIFLIGAIFTALAFLSKERMARRLLFLSAFIWISGVFVSFHHVGVQFHWFSPPSFCVAPEPLGGSIAEIAEQLLNTPVARCDRVDFFFLGQPPSTYICFVMLCMALACFFGTARPASQKETDPKKQREEVRLGRTPPCQHEEGRREGELPCAQPKGTARPKEAQTQERGLKEGELKEGDFLEKKQREEAPLPLPPSSPPPSPSSRLS